MRLSKQQIDAFIQAINTFLPKNEKVELRLFGSRTDDGLKGGDIDLLIVTQTQQTCDSIASHKANLLAKIFMQIDEEKIDISVITQSEIPNNAFIQSVAPASLLIHQWN